MAPLLKDIYSPRFYTKFAAVLKERLPAFDSTAFMSAIFIDTWEQKELKDRMRHTSRVLHEFLPRGFPAAATIIEDLIAMIQEKPFTNGSLEFLFFPDYIETFGIDHFDRSVKSIELVTPFISCEFAVRPFIIKYGEKMIRQMQLWSLHENYHVRRLSSEGSRPRLPWGIALPVFKKDPSAILPILENLKQDPSEYVRRSVANSLNDISKDNPQLLLQIIRKWNGTGPATDAIIKHGSRGLLKAAQPAILSYFGLNEHRKVSITGLSIHTPLVKTGAYLGFSFLLENTGRKQQLVRLEYAIYYLKQNGQSAKKVFKISEKMYKGQEKLVINKQHSFRPITTRKYYPGIQQVAIIINGVQKALGTFELHI